MGQSLSSFKLKNTKSLSRENKAKVGFSCLVGMLLGILSSFIVNATLTEISLNIFFSLYFGILFIGLGSLIIWRILTSKSDIVKARKKFLIFFSCMVILSGFMSFLLEKHWFKNIAPILKIPLYTILGVSITYAIVFSLVDLINHCAGLFQKAHERPIVESNSQVYIVLIFSVLMGGVYGFLFGYLDIEDATFLNFNFLFMKDQYFCIPFGILFGGAAGGLNEYYRQQGGEYAFHKLPTDNFNEEI